MSSLTIGILGTRGIPNHYGGFEQLAEYLSMGLSRKGHKVLVYNPHNHPYKAGKWKGVSITHCYSMEHIAGTAGQFIYDLNCILDARKRNLDVLLILGYTSMSVWGKLFPKKSTIIINMDGFEWKRAKYSNLVQKFLLYAEKLAVTHSRYYVADSTKIQSYLQNKYGIGSRHIAYGAELFSNEAEELLAFYYTKRNDYYLLIARIEPENNIEMILDGFAASNSERKFIVIGNAQNEFGEHLLAKFGTDKRIQFAGTMYDKRIKHSLCCYSAMYFHGHSTGGTNPSLLEAMASRALIAAHDNEFNREILDGNAYYFSDAAQVQRLIENNSRNQKETAMIANNLKNIELQYNWESIVNQYEAYILDCHKNQVSIERNTYYKGQSN
jgi:glycosyltransferase involved in cell wall biosynthesis